MNAGSSDPATLTISRAAARIVSAASAPKRAKSSARAHHRRSETSSLSRRLQLANLLKSSEDGRQICPENFLRSFFADTLPQIKASVLTGGIFAFISAMDETVVGLFISGGQYQPLTKRMFTALRDEIDPTIAAISTLMTAASFLLVLIASTRQKKSG